MKRISLALFIICLALPALATTVIPRSVEELTVRSSNVVVGKALRTWSQWNADHTVIFTYTEFAVERSLKGKAVRTITVKQLGGSADGITQKVSGQRRLRVGEQAVLFLRPSQKPDGTLAITGLMQGHFRITKSPSGESFVSNGITGAAAFDVRTGKLSERKAVSMKLSQLEERVRKVAQ